MKTNVLQLGQASSEPLPFNEAITDTRLDTWATLYRGPGNRQIASRHCPALGDTYFLTQHPSSENVVVQALASKFNLNELPSALQQSFLMH